MNTFDRHLLREWLYVLGLVIAATCGLLVVQVLYDDFRNLRELGAQGPIYWEFLGEKITSFFAISLPFALLVSLLFVLGKLNRANEFTAMRAAGVGFLRLTAPIWVVGVMCCGLAWWLNTSLVPWSVEQSESIMAKLRFRHDSARAVPDDRVGAAYSVAFDNAQARRMWFFNRFSRYTNRGYGVAVSELDGRRREVTRIVAAQAWPVPARNGWAFKNGRNLVFNPENGELVASTPFAEEFKEGYAEEPALMLLIDRRPIDLSLHELRKISDYLAGQHSAKSIPYAVRYFGLIADTLGPLIVIAIAIPFAITGVRVNPAVGVSKSIGLFALYYLLTNVAFTLATKEIVDPDLAAWLPNIGMAALAAWFLARLR